MKGKMRRLSGDEDDMSESTIEEDRVGEGEKKIRGIPQTSLQLLQTPHESLILTNVIHEDTFYLST